MKVIILSAIAGIFGMGLGGFISVLLLRRMSDNMVCCTLSFAGGIMTSIVCFGLIPESVELSGVTVSIAGLSFGIVFIMILNCIVDKITATKDQNLKIHSTHKELYHINTREKKMIHSGIIMLIAISLHNVPEGIAIGAGGSYDLELGALLTIMVTLHNVPEGMAIAAPLLAGGINRGSVILLTALSGATTLLGGFVGVTLGNISDFSVAISLSAAGGAMLYVVFGEIIPQSVVMTKSRMTSLATLFGVMVGLMITKI